ncbi:MAG TPA: FHA domain-containing protein, partial [Thermoflexales bacterium]|nr:FHA domain-containing protein [Thermoflexales bacterium]
ALDLNLVDPAGRQVTTAYPGATIRTFSNLVYAIIKQPMEGKWNATAFGRVVPEGTLKWDSVFSVRGTAKTMVTTRNNTDWGPILVVLLALLIAMGLGALVVITSRGQTGSRGLLVPSGARMPLRISPGRRLRLGRDDFNDVVLSDSRASRMHAEISAHEDGSFTVRDLGSRNGTHLNGRRIHVARAYPGDTLQIGRTKLELE